jgi:hypothetical protein
MEPQEDKFEIAFRVLGNEIFAMNLISKSAKKNWAVFGVVLLILVSILMQQLAPLISTIYQMVG